MKDLDLIRNSIGLQLELFNSEKVKVFFPQLDQNVLLLEKTMNHHYKTKKLAQIALMHPSTLSCWPLDRDDIFSYERLEFLGDSCVNFFVTVRSVVTHPKWDEGVLSKLRSHLVRTEFLAELSKETGISELILLGKSELQKKGITDNILADAFEAICASLFLDAGIDKLFAWLDTIFKKPFSISSSEICNFDAKSKLQNYTQAVANIHPTYIEISQATEEHNETLFTVACEISGIEVSRGSAKNKKAASKIAAEIALDRIHSGDITEQTIKLWTERTKQ